MFVSHDKNSSKKIFQKPNILRKKTKATKPKLSLNKNEATAVASLVTTQHVNESSEQINTTREGSTLSNKPTVWKILGNSDDGEIYLEPPEETDIDANISNGPTVFSNITENNNKNFDQISLNIESFINNEEATKDPSAILIDKSESVQQPSQPKTKWCFDISNNAMDIISIDNYTDPKDLEQKSEYIVDVVHSGPTVVSELQSEEVQQSHEQSPLVTTSIQTMSVDCFSNRTIKYKCDYPNCNKGFWIEERLKKHKSTHERQTTARSRVVIECPVKKVEEDGTEQRCPQTFQVRGELLKHLNADHTPEDALHRCEVCGRRFFWASGLRAHAQSVCARGGLACGWPGCSRTFPLPCRLREHARTHTGNRPYVCQYPDCGWAFRSASKLVRHARRHTGERRHACSACGRAFRRREHLRDHAARHHAPRARPLLHCTHTGCEQTFTNMSSLYMHMKRVHRKDKKEGGSVTKKTAAAKQVTNEEYVLQMGAVGEAGDIGDMGTGLEAGEAGEAGGAGGAGGAARTHVPWPLARHARTIDDIVTVEQAEDSGSNVYTVRSDLFLHSNVPIDEDSQHIGGSVQMVASSEDGTEPLDAGLGLHDHPTIDLMQEELIYEDAAVDETSFRLLLMNGEELT